VGRQVRKAAVEGGSVGVAVAGAVVAIALGVALAMGKPVGEGVGVLPGVLVGVAVAVAVGVGVAIGSWAVTRPIRLPRNSVNHRLPSGPAVIPQGPLPVAGRANSAFDKEKESINDATSTNSASRLSRQH